MHGRRAVDITSYRLPKLERRDHECVGTKDALDEGLKLLSLLLHAPELIC